MTDAEIPFDFFSTTDVEIIRGITDRLKELAPPPTREPFTSYRVVALDPTSRVPLARCMTPTSPTKKLNSAAPTSPTKRAPMTDVEIIQGVIDRLKDPTHWVKGIRGLAATEHGGQVVGVLEVHPVLPTDPSATMWCLGGAVMNVVQNEEWTGWWAGTRTDFGQSVRDSVGERFHQLARDHGFSAAEYPFVEFNNHPATTHEDLMLFLKEALYDAEIEAARTA